MAKLNFNKNRFIKKVQNAFGETMSFAADKMQDQIIEEERVYPRVTVRKKGVGKTGQIASSPRDVVDEGKLRDSYEVTIEYQGDKVILTAEWSAEHGKYIYYGTDKQPPYPWIRIALRQLNLKKEFFKRWGEKQ